MYISDRYRVDIEGLVVAHGDHLVALLVVLHAPHLVGQEVSLMKIGKIYEEGSHWLLLTMSLRVSDYQVSIEWRL